MGVSTASVGVSSVVTRFSDAVGGGDDETSGSPVIVGAVVTMILGGINTTLSDSVPLCSILSSSSSLSS